MNFRSVKVELPTEERMFPGGDKAAAINGNCLACHSASMVLNQPPLTRAVWSAEVHKMVSAYKAPVSPQDVDAIIAYLVQTNGKP
jgi:mono/diheme cytochrome c family protein